MILTKGKTARQARKREILSSILAFVTTLASPTPLTQDQKDTARNEIVKLLFELNELTAIDNNKIRIRR